MSFRFCFLRALCALLHYAAAYDYSRQIAATPPPIGFTGHRSFRHFSPRPGRRSFAAFRLLYFDAIDISLLPNNDIRYTTPPFAFDTLSPPLMSEPPPPFQLAASSRYAMPPSCRRRRQIFAAAQPPFLQ